MLTLCIDIGIPISRIKKKSSLTTQITFLSGPIFKIFFFKGLVRMKTWLIDWTWPYPHTKNVYIF